MNDPPTGVSTFRVERGLRAVICGLGAVRERLAAEVDAQQLRRPMIVCGASVARSPALDTVRRALDRDVLVFDGSRPHTPVETVDAGAALARANDADGLVAVGGSSAVDCAKGIAVLLGTDTATVADLEPVMFGRLSEQSDATARRTIGVVMVTTTLSFAEFLPFWGARHGDTARKVPYGDSNCVDRTAFLDGEIAVHTPTRVWNETAVKALDDTILAFCRSDGEPFCDPILLSATRQLTESLRGTGEIDLAARRQSELVATWMTKMALPRLAAPRFGGWFSTAARHALGAVFELSHGVGSCVALPHALEYHLDLTGARQAEMADALGWPVGNGAPLSAGLAEFLTALAVPTRLRDAGIGAAELDAVVDRMLDESPTLAPRDRLQRACEAMV
ncbi:MAG TPA: iron-containing alcohol dehydrogenase [Acidimicrobiales bacterium]|nr:iron-containing alcohol dehydrogenase [Acidimicrobiales bacterium]